MRVKATRMGYYGHKRRKQGEVFDLVAVKGKDKDGKPFVIAPEKQFSANWMEVVKGKAKAAPADEPEDDDVDAGGDDAGTGNQDAI